MQYLLETNITMLRYLFISDYHEFKVRVSPLKSFWIDFIYLWNSKLRCTLKNIRQKVLKLYN